MVLARVSKAKINLLYEMSSGQAQVEPYFVLARDDISYFSLCGPIT